MRGHGKVVCPNPRVAEMLLAREHFLGERRIVIEKMKYPDELADKYHDLQARQLKIVIPLPTPVPWSRSFFH